MPYRRATMVLAAALVSSAAAAQPYAILSAIGSQLTVVGYVVATASGVDRNRQTTLGVEDGALDKMVLDAGQAILEPKATVHRLVVDDAQWLAAVREASIEEKSELRGLLEPVVAAARNMGARRLVAVVPARTPIRLEVKASTLGSGRAAGFGVYVDRTLNIGRSDTRERGAGGFLGLFANFRIMVVDTATGETLAEAPVSRGSAWSSARSSDANLLNVLTPEQKLAEFRRLVRTGLERELPALLERAAR